MGKNKMSKIFYSDKVICEYECKEQWEECVDYLKEKILLYPNEKSMLYSFAARCWYVLTFWDCSMPKEKLNRSVFENGLENAYSIAKNNWWNDSDCLWLFGYFMCINQLDFCYVGVNIDEVEREGERLIKKAYTSTPQNLLAEVLYLADHGKKSKYMAAKKKLEIKIDMYFSNQSEVDMYFSGIFIG